TAAAVAGPTVRRWPAVAEHRRARFRDRAISTTIFRFEGQQRRRAPIAGNRQQRRRECLMNAMMNEMLRRRGYTRREFHATLAKLGLGFAAVGATTKMASAAENDLTVFTWGGYELPEF